VRTVYAGTSDFAAAVLRGLASGPHRPALVIAPPDRRSGRGRRLSPPPAAVAAGELEIELLQTEDVNAAVVAERIAAAGAEVAVVCAFGQLVKEPLLSAIEWLNVHPSLLPRWRGAAPIERAIMAGDERTGVCVMRLTAGLDSGPLALCDELAIGPSEDYGALSERLAAAGGRLLGAALDRRAGGELGFSEQSGGGITYAEKIGAAERQVDPGGEAAAEARRIRALTPHVGAFAVLADGSRLGLREPTVAAAGPDAGVWEPDGEALLLGCREGALRIGSVQPPGRRWMTAADYLRGHGPPSAAAVSPR